MQKVVETALFSPPSIAQLTYRLSQLKRDPSEDYSGYLIESSEYLQRAIAFNEIIDVYVNAINCSRRKKLVESSVPTKFYRVIDNELTSIWQGITQPDTLLSLFDSYHNPSLYNSGFTLKNQIRVKKEILLESAENYTQALISAGIIKRSLINCIVCQMNKTVVESFYELNSVSDVIQQARQLSAGLARISPCLSAAISSAVLGFTAILTARRSPRSGLRAAMTSSRANLCG